jgi:hypothetical protein
MANSNRRSSQKRPEEAKQSELMPLKLPPDPDKRQGATDDDDVFIDDDDIAPDPPRPPTSSIRYQPSPPPSDRRRIDARAERADRDTTRDAGQVSSAFPGPLRARAGRNTATGAGIAPMPQASPRPRRQLHWLVYVGVGMIAAIALWVSFGAILAWGTAKYDDLVYGNPRIFQTDAVVGHGGSPAHPSHFIALNLHAQVIVIELPAGNPAKSYEYVGPYLIGNGDDLIPITLTFSDVNHNGKPEMIIHIQDREVIFCNDGTKFTQCSS